MGIKELLEHCTTHHSVMKSLDHAVVPLFELARVFSLPVQSTPIETFSTP